MGLMKSERRSKDDGKHSTTIISTNEERHPPFHSKTKGASSPPEGNHSPKSLMKWLKQSNNPPTAVPVKEPTPHKSKKAWFPSLSTPKKSADKHLELQEAPSQETSATCNTATGSCTTKQSPEQALSRHHDVKRSLLVQLHNANPAQLDDYHPIVSKGGNSSSGSSTDTTKSTTRYHEDVTGAPKCESNNNSNNSVPNELQRQHFLQESSDHQRITPHNTQLELSNGRSKLGMLQHTCDQEHEDEILSNYLQNKYMQPLHDSNHHIAQDSVDPLSMTAGTYGDTKFYHIPTEITTIIDHQEHAKEEEQHASNDITNKDHINNRQRILAESETPGDSMDLDAEELQKRLIHAEMLIQAYREKLEQSDNAIAALNKDMQLARKSIHHIARRNASLHRRWKRAVSSEAVVAKLALGRACAMTAPIFLICGGFAYYMLAVCVVWSILEAENILYPTKGDVNDVNDKELDEAEETQLPKNGILKSRS